MMTNRCNCSRYSRTFFDSEVLVRKIWYFAFGRIQWLSEREFYEASKPAILHHWMCSPRIIKCRINKLLSDYNIERKLWNTQFFLIHSVWKCPGTIIITYVKIEIFGRYSMQIVFYIHNTMGIETIGIEFVSICSEQLLQIFFSFTCFVQLFFMKSWVGVNLFIFGRKVNFLLWFYE